MDACDVQGRNVHHVQRNALQRRRESVDITEVTKVHRNECQQVGKYCPVLLFNTERNDGCRVCSLNLFVEPTLSSTLRRSLPAAYLTNLT